MSMTLPADNRLQATTKTISNGLRNVASLLPFHESRYKDGGAHWYRSSAILLHYHRCDYHRPVSITHLCHYHRCHYHRPVSLSQVSLSQMCHYHRCVIITDVSLSQTCVIVTDVSLSQTCVVRSILRRSSGTFKLFLPGSVCYYHLSRSGFHHSTYQGNVATKVPVNTCRS